MDLRRLRAFVAVAESGSVSRAAQRCGITQPSLSQQIRTLEREIGHPLFDRLGRGMALTEAGTALLPRARRIIAEIRDAEASLQTDIASGRGGLAIGAIPTMAPYLLPPVLHTLRVELPDCPLTVHEQLTEHLIELLLDNQIECAIMSGAPNNDQLVAQHLFDEPLVAVGPPVGRFLDRHLINLPDLRTLPIITLIDMHCLGRQIEGFCTEQDVGGRVVCRTAQIGTIIEMVALGLGVSILPQMAVAGDDRRRVGWARINRLPPQRQITAVWRRDRRRSLAARRAVELIKQDLGRGAHSLPSTLPVGPRPASSVLHG